MLRPQFQIRTNFGRCASFIPDELRTDRPGEPFPGPPYPTFEGKYYSDAYYSKETLRAPEGQVIIGFTSILEVSTALSAWSCATISHIPSPGK